MVFYEDMRVGHSDRVVLDHFECPRGAQPSDRYDCDSCAVKFKFWRENLWQPRTWRDFRGYLWKELLLPSLEWVGDQTRRRQIYPFPSFWKSQVWGSFLRFFVTNAVLQALAVTADRTRQVWIRALVPLLQNHIIDVLHLFDSWSSAWLLVVSNFFLLGQSQVNCVSQLWEMFLFVHFCQTFSSLLSDLLNLIWSNICRSNGFSFRNFCDFFAIPVMSAAVVVVALLALSLHLVVAQNPNDPAG